MRKNGLIILILFLSISCKEQVEKFYSDTSKYSIINKSIYEYKLNKKESLTQITTVYFLGKLADSISIKTLYKYNKRNLLEKEIIDYNSENASVTLYAYNKIDSLLSEITIEPEGDTSFWREFSYFPDGRKTTFERFLMIKFDNEDNNSNKRKSFDTIYERNEYNYNNKFCKTLKQFNRKGDLTNLVEYYYEKSRVSKEISYSFSNSIKILKKTKYYNYSKSDNFPDSYTLDTFNDTIEKCVNEFENYDLVTSTNYYNSGNEINKVLLKNGKVIMLVSIDKIENMKRIEFISYYSNGDEKESRIYREKINAR